MIPDAIDAAFALGWALLIWLLISAAVCTVALLGAAALTAWAWTAVQKRRRRPSWARGPHEARDLARKRLRPGDGRTRLPDDRKTA